MEKNNFIKFVIALILVINPLCIPMLGKVNTNNNYIYTDIMVVGGGTAGVVAAIQSARAGCSTILLECDSQLGGTMTTGGVSFPGLFHAWGKQVIRGIGWELVNDVVNLNGDQLPDFSIPCGIDHPKHQIQLNGYLYSLIAEEKCIQSGVQIRYYETPAKITFRHNKWHVLVVGKGISKTIICKELIDCTGNAAIVNMAGYNLQRSDEIQPGSLLYQLAGYDISSLNRKDLEARFNDAVQNGLLRRHDACNGIWNVLTATRPTSSMHILGADSSTSETHTYTNILGRKSLLNLYRFVKTLPGCEKTYIKVLQTEVSVRETYRINGLYSITSDDYYTGKNFEDAIAYAFYPIDLHVKNGVSPKHLPEGVVATIPLRALIPKNSTNLIVAGRCVSSDQLANSALRVQASCMAMGQAAACAAVLACRHNISISEVNIDELKKMITKYDGIVPN